ncbi:hypothetical protein FQN60_006726 [Etheostoma spectabile]|uniref:Uncharacterized protein n=1 Tax=Etheostoma spectabile TaxID=54343 RepID=A0A5J5CF48_9PERO|nr:hypothetical protein FQN60_006726 [Etheostoma spectabile]
MEYSSPGLGLELLFSGLGLRYWRLDSDLTQTQQLMTRTQTQTGDSRLDSDLAVVGDSDLDSYSNTGDSRLDSDSTVGDSDLDSDSTVGDSDLDSYSNTSDFRLDSDSTVSDSDLDSYSNTGDSRLDSDSTVGDSDLDSYSNTGDSRLDSDSTVGDSASNTSDLRLDSDSTVGDLDSYSNTSDSRFDSDSTVGASRLDFWERRGKKACSISSCVLLKAERVKKIWNRLPVARGRQLTGPGLSIAAKTLRSCRIYACGILDSDTAIKGSPGTMRQAVEAQVLSPHCELGEHGLRQILTDVITEVRKSVNQDVDGAEILHGLLNASWLQSLLKV